MEKLMQYIWQHRLWRPASLTAVDGRKVKLIDPGTLNTGSGPDFFNAKVMIDGHLWAGNVEIHVRASDWKRHGHHLDRAYDNVVLHVVEYDDMAVHRSDGEVIPQVIMPAAADFSVHYSRLVARADSSLPCREEIASLPQLYVSDWIAALAHERLYAKVERIEGLLSRFSGDWREVCYVSLARALGFGLNSEPFERLALATPLRVLMKHSDSPLALEAMLFGQSGLLGDVPQGRRDRYVESLLREYGFMQSKFGLKPIGSECWRTGRMRPHNLPHRRIALLAAFVAEIHGLFAGLTSASGIDEVRSVLNTSLSGYWPSHFTLGGQEATTTSALSRASLDVMVINVAVPLVYAYGLYKGDDSACTRAVDMLCGLGAESNSVVAMFRDAGVRCCDAFTSQALIQLRRAYCEPRKCLYCRIGHRMLSRHAVRTNQ